MTFFADDPPCLFVVRAFESQCLMGYLSQAWLLSRVQSHSVSWKFYIFTTLHQWKKSFKTNRNVWRFLWQSHNYIFTWWASFSSRVRSRGCEERFNRSKYESFRSLISIPHFVASLINNTCSFVDRSYNKWRSFIYVGWSSREKYRRSWSWEEGGR